MDEQRILGHAHDMLHAELSEAMAMAALMEDEAGLAILQRRMASLEKMRGVMDL